MRKAIAALLLICLLFTAAALAQGNAGSVMRVVNCQEWVSLRERPDARSQCLVEVPLGALVENCRKENKTFYYGEFRGMSGYIMTQYLETAADVLSDPSEMMIIGGQWAPMYADTTENATLLQWMAPGERLKDAREPVDGFIYGSCRGVKGYVAAHLAAPAENAGDEASK